MRIERLRALPDDLALLTAPAAAEGFAFLERVRAEWNSGANRFDEPGEALFAARADGRLVGLCGLNVDPYAGEPEVGRLRNLYVHPEARGGGTGADLVRSVLERAAGRFRVLRLRAVHPGLDAYYRRFGFAPAQAARATHALALPDPGDVELVSVRRDDVLGRLASWLASEHVARWCREPAAVLSQARAPLDLEQAWIHWRGRPVGYLRWRHPTRAELDRAGLLEVPTSALDADLAIGEPDALGRAVAPRALRRLRERLSGRGDAVALILRAPVDNQAAVRAFAAAGFARRRRFEDPGGGPAWLFVAELH